MSLGDTPLVIGDGVLYKDIVRPSTSQNLGGGFITGQYRAVNITDPTSSNTVKMFYVEVFGATGNANVGSQQIPFPGGLTFNRAYVVLQDLLPTARLKLYLTYGSNSYISFQIRATNYNPSNDSAAFLVIGV
jgi:hypothetical protein